MTSQTTDQFWKAYGRLDKSVREQAREAFKLEVCGHGALGRHSTMKSAGIKGPPPLQH